MRLYQDGTKIQDLWKHLTKCTRRGHKWYKSSKDATYKACLVCWKMKDI